MRLSRVDREAMGRAVEQMRAENPASREQIERKLTEQGLEEAGQTAAYHCQDTALKLKPWMTPPCWLRTARDVKAALREPLPDAHGKRANWWSGCWRPD
jgi:hypothetical protein